MPSTDSTNQKNSLHGLIIALIVLNTVGLLALYVKVHQAFSPRRMKPTMMYKQGQQMMRDDSLGMPSVKEKKMRAENSSSTEWVTYDGWNLSFKYPREWRISYLDDDFVEGQKNIVLRSSEGVLRLGGGPEIEGEKYFEDGFQVTMRRLATGQNVGRVELTRFPNIQTIIEECDGAGCHSAEYIYTGDNGRYHLIFDWMGSHSALSSTLVEIILSSLQEKT